MFKLQAGDLSSSQQSDDIIAQRNILVIYFISIIATYLSKNVMKCLNILEIQT
jgi:hypothetical protein